MHLEYQNAQFIPYEIQVWSVLFCIQVWRSLFATFANKDLQLKYTSLHALGGRQSTLTVVCMVNNEILASCSAMQYTCWL